MSKNRNWKVYKEELQEFHKIAKAADTRLRRLEKLSEQSGFENVGKWAYQKAMRDIRYWSGEGKTTFNRDAPTGLKQLRAKMADIREFLKSVTSTKSGIKSMFKDRADALNEKWGTDFTWDQLGDIFDRAEGNTFYKNGAKSYMKAVDYLQKNEDRIMKQLKGREDVTVRTGNRKTDQIVRGLLDDYGIQFDELY